jgi:phosphatidylserine/phosphatidylglycerophosphate/cardiolipin synthase-like enzyme
MAIDDWLDEATPADLDGLALALTDGRIPQLGASASIQRAGFGEEAIAFLRDLEGTPPIYIARLLARLAQERRSADDRYAKVAQLVWSGESEDDEAIRDTRVVLDDLFRRAERHVLIATYVIYDGLAVFRALADRMRTKPGLDVDLYVNMFSKTGYSDDEQREVADYIDTFRRNHWPSSVRLPNIYYDPETRKLGPERCSLHAKCVVVDDRWAFVTSANFTEAAQKRNIEAGIVLDHPRIAQALVARFEALRESGVFRRMA